MSRRLCGRLFCTSLFTSFSQVLRPLSVALTAAGVLVSLALAPVAIVPPVVVDGEAHREKRAPVDPSLVSPADFLLHIHYRSRASVFLRTEVPTSTGLGFEMLGRGDSSPFVVLELMKAVTP